MKKNTEEFTVNGEDILKKVKVLIREGNIRRITIRSKSGKDLINIPLTAGLIGIVAAPYLTAIGGLAALITECTIVVERKDES